MKLKKLLSSVLVASMLLSSMAFTAFAEDATTTTPTYAAVITSADDLGVGAEGEYSTVYYGGIPWRVLSKEYSSDSTNEDAKKGILLLSEHAMANGIQFNAHYSNNRWSSKNKAWASAMWMPWDDERNPNYANNIANGEKTDDSSGGYLTSDVRMYLTGLGTYETFRPYAFYNEAWPANWFGTPDNNSKANKYYVRNEVTDSEPVDGVTYFVKGEFELSDHDRTDDEDGVVPITAADFAENTWYTLDSEGNPVLLESFPEDADTVDVHFDQAGYSIADVSNGFEDNVKYYTFERKTTAGDVLPTVTTNGVEYPMGEHLAGLYLFTGYSIPELGNSNSADAITNGTFVAGLDASEKNFAKDMGFSELEMAAVLPTSGHGYTRGSGVNVSVGTTYGDRLDNDTYFSLSGEEVKLYLTDAGHNKAATYFDGNAVGDIWTRSWGKFDTQCVIVYTNNACSWIQGANNTWQSIRPAFNLNPDAVVMYVPAEDDVFAEMTAGNNEYKMVMLDEERADFTYTVTPSENGATITYENAIVGENEWITAVVMDADGNITHYGEVAEVEEANGTVELAITDVEMIGKKIYIFNEQCNGTNATNYSNAFGEGFKIVTSNTLAEVLGDMESDETIAVQTNNNGIVEVTRVNDEVYEIGEATFDITDIDEGIEVTIPTLGEIAIEDDTTSQKHYEVVVEHESTKYENTAATLKLDISLKCTYDGVTEDVETNGEVFTVKVKLPANADTERPITILHDGEPITEYEIEGEYVVFETDGFSPFDISYSLRSVDVPAVTEMCQAAKVSFVENEANENNTIYDIVIESTDGKDIFGLVSAQMDISEAAEMSGVNFVVEGANDFIVTDNEADDSYLFTLKSANNQALADTKSGTSVTIGKLTISGFTTDIETAVVGTYTVNAVIETDDGAATSYLDTSVTTKETKNIHITLEGSTINYTKDVPKNELTIEVTFPKNISDNDFNYQDMKITVTEQDLGKVAEFNLGENGDATIVDNKYTVSAELQRYKTYTVKIEGAGYRTFTKTVELDADKTMIVWNNYKDNGALIIKNGETTPEAVATITFLAGDIVKDNTVNAYDLSVLLSYAFTDGIDTTAASKYAQYDLNRDGLINYKDAAMILDTYVWGK